MKRCAKEKYYYGGMLLVAIFMFFLHMFTRPWLHDDQLFYEAFQQEGVLNYLQMRYTTWTSRLFSDFVFICVSQLPFWVWMVCDTLMYVFIYMSAHSLFELKEKDNIFAAMAICCYVFLQMASAGWIITSLTYTWSLAAGMICLMYLKQSMCGQRVGAIQALIYIVCMLYACNYEILGVVMLLIYFALLVWSFAKKSDKKRSYLLYGGLILQIVSLIFIFTTPGNYARFEVADLQYDQLSILGKIRIGMVSTYEHFISFPNILFGVFWLVLLLIVLEQNKDLKQKIVAAFLFLADVIYTMYYVVKDILIGGKRNYVFDNPEMIPLSTNEWVRQIFMCVFFVAIAIGALYLIWNVVENKGEFWLALLVLAAGMASRMAMCFTGSIYESGTRTYIGLYFAFSFVIAMMMKYVTKRWNRFMIGGCLAAGMGINMILTLIPYLQNYS